MRYSSRMDVESKPCPHVHASIRTGLGVAALRDLHSAEVDALVGYWHNSGSEHLDVLGIDRARLGSAHDTRQRFRCALRSGDPEQRTLAFAITLNGALVGYTLLNRYTPETNYSHWHIINPTVRAAGLSTALYPHRIQLYFALTPMRRLIHQTRTRNVGVNRMLDRYVPIAETRYIERPNGVAAPGEFHLRYVVRSDIPRLFELARGLR